MASIGLVNIASALTPNIRWRGHLLLQFEPVEAMRLFHALALPAGAALLLVSPYLFKRRRRAWQVAHIATWSRLLLARDVQLTRPAWITFARASAGCPAQAAWSEPGPWHASHPTITSDQVVWNASWSAS